MPDRTTPTTVNIRAIEDTCETYDITTASTVTGNQAPAGTKLDISSVIVNLAPQTGGLTTPAKLTLKYRKGSAYVTFATFETDTSTGEPINTQLDFGAAELNSDTQAAAGTVKMIQIIQGGTAAESNSHVTIIGHYKSA